jgi:hypothetical protein
MNFIAIQLPPVVVEHSVDVEVSVNGKKEHLKYRLELLRWADWCTPEETRADGIRKMVNRYEGNWQLIEIGAPSDTAVPLMFRMKTRRAETETAAYSR